MSNSETNIVERARKELEQIFERMRRNCEAGLEIFQDIDLDGLRPESREQLYGQIHTFREIVRILSPDFEKKLTVKTEKVGRGLSPDEVRCLLYGIDEL
jgi:hypothetical protein